MFIFHLVDANDGKATQGKCCTGTRVGLARVDVVGEVTDYLGKVGI
jgi:hypothetical protein